MRPYRLLGSLVAGILAAALYLGANRIGVQAPDLYREGFLLGLKIAVVGCLAASVMFLFPRPVLIPVDLSPQTAIAKPKIWLLLLLFLVAVALQIPRLNDSLWGDELNTLVRIVHRGLVIIVSFSSAGNNHVANSVLMWLSTNLFGEGEWQSRLPALLLTASTGPVVYLVLRRHLAESIAALTAGWITLSSASLDFGGNARGYSGGILLCFLTITQAERILAGGKRYWPYVVAAFGAVAFLPFSAFVVAGHGFTGIWLLFRSWRRKEAWRSSPGYLLLYATMVTTTLVLICLGPTLGQIIEYAGTADARRDHPGANSIQILKILELITGAYGGIFAGLVVVIIAVAGFALMRNRERPLVTAAAGPLFVGILYAMLPTSFASARLYFFVVPSLAIGLALLLEYARTSPHRNLVWAGVGLSMISVLAGSGRMLNSLWTIGTPDLKHLAAEYPSRPMLLTGTQEGLNQYYLPTAGLIKESDISRVGGDTLILLGTNTPDEYRVPEGLSPIKILRSWDPDQPSYLLLEATRP